MQLGVVRRAIRIFLTRQPGYNDAIPATYEGIYNACRALVTVSHRGEDVYNALKMELEQSIGRLSSELLDSDEEDTTWIASFNAAFKWFESQIVRRLSTM